jgi:hypothetical protein
MNKLKKSSSLFFTASSMSLKKSSEKEKSSASNTNTMKSLYKEHVSFFPQSEWDTKMSID